MGLQPWVTGTFIVGMSVAGGRERPLNLAHPDKWTSLMAWWGRQEKPIIRHCIQCIHVWYSMVWKEASLGVLNGSLGRSFQEGITVMVMTVVETEDLIWRQE